MSRAKQGGIGINFIDNDLQKEISTGRALTSADNGYTIFLTNTVAMNLTIDSGLPDNFECNFIQKGIGTTTFIDGTATVVAPDGFVLINGIGNVCALIKRLAVDELFLVGELEAPFVQGGGFNSLCNGVGLQSDGKIVCVGNFTDYDGTTVYSIARLNTDGSVDNSFIYGVGFATTGISGCTIYPDDDDTIVFGWFSTFNDLAQVGMVKLNKADGSKNTNFVVKTFTALGNIYGVEVDTNGDLIVIGQFTGYDGNSSNRIVKINIDGTYDSSLDVGTGFPQNPAVIKIQDDGKILVGGDFITYDGNAAVRIVRLNANGSIDTDFATNIGTGANDTVKAIAFQDDNKIVIGGDFTTFDSNASKNICRLNADGSFDNTFIVGSGISNGVLDIVIEANQNIVAAGSFGQYDGELVGRICRVSPNGSLDFNFPDGTGFSVSQNVQQIIVLPSKRLVCVGSFSGYNELGYKRLCILNPDGSPHSSL